MEDVSGPGNLAYVIYTSGSTGRPKGVLVEQEALIDHIYGGIARMGLDNCRRYGLVSSLVADGNHSMLFSALLTGAELHVLPEELVLDGDRLSGYLQEQQIDCVKMVPSHWLSCGEAGSYPLPGKVLILGGEAFPAGILDRLRAWDYKGKVFNHYGPTEVTIGKSVHEVDLARKYDRVPIGRPFANGRLYILDGEGRLSPTGIAGELHVGGAGLARGYLNRADLTAEKFVADPFVEGGRMYKTGDICRWTAEGEIEYWGRADDQVKVRGYRIEPGEIEGAVLQSGMAEQVAVKVWQERLVGYVVAEEFDQGKLMDYLNVQLPEYLIPKLWMQLESMPLTASGKTDRKQLPEPSISGDSHIAPRTATEIELTAIWQEVLKIDRVGITDNFFELGGHSLLAIRILGRINSRWQIKIGLAELFSSPTVMALANRIGRSVAVVTEAIPLAPAMEHYPVSSGQLRLWVLQQLYPGNYSYNIVHRYTYAGVLDAERLQQALDIVVERHEILRTRFMEFDGEPRQVVLTPEAGRIVAVWSRQSLTDAVRQESRHVFDLTAGPLLRVQVVPTAENVHKLVMNIHHIITDEWSMEVLLREWTDTYEGRMERSPLRIQYKDYAVWQREQLLGSPMEQSQRFWMEQFRDQKPVAELPADHRRSAVADFRGENINYWLPVNLQQQLRRLAAERDVSMYMLLLSLTEVLLYNYTGESRVVTGTPSLGRDHADLEGQIGFYVNTLAISGEVKNEETFVSLLERTKEQVLQCYAHERYPFDRLVSELNITREVNRNPLFDLMVAYHQTEVSVEAIEKDETASKFDCRLVLIDTEQGLQLQLNYRTSLYDRSRMERMIGHLERLAEQVVADPQSIVGSLSLLSPQEQERLLTLGQSEAAYPRNKSVVALWREQVGHTPLATALVYGDERLSYQEVDRWSSRVAGWLADQRLLPEERVAVVMDRTIRSIVAILAVLKAGGAFVPLDPAWPQERKLFLWEDAGCRLVLGGEALPESSTEVEDVSGPGSLAYVIYTSGSTGRPKGVLVEQEALIDHIYGGIARMGLDACHRYGLVSSLVADGNHSMLFSALLTGAELHVLPEELVLDGDRLSGYLQEQQIDCVKMVPSHWLSCGEGGSYPLPGKVLILGGEAFPAGIVDRLRAWDYKGKVFNHYGPTEVTIGKSVYEADLKKNYNRVPIGRPFANGRLYILNGEGRLSPTGIAGELHVGGAGLARGYLNREDLTAEKFVADPFVEGGRMYKTGDICRWTAEGEIEYWGRADDQVKVRGYRIEPGEIEQAVLQSGMAEQVAVKVWQERLVGYVVAEGFDQAKLVGYLGGQLPEYMVPQLWVELDALPLTASGKTDRKQLPEPSISGDSYIAPQTATEAELAAIWQDVLKIERVGITDNFFELGGHSLLAIRILSRINSRWQIKIGLAELFGSPTVMALANRIGQSGVVTIEAIPEASVIEHYPLSSGQLRLWVLQQLYPGNYSYNIVHQYTYAGVLEPERLQQALDTVVERHEILRTRFMEIEGEPRQVILPPSEGRVLIGWSTQTAAELVRQESRHVFDLTTGPLLRVQVVAQSENLHRLVVNIHHIITDEWSMEVLLREWTEAYEGELKGLPLRIQYKDYAVWEQEQLTSGRLEKMRQFWMDQFDGQEPVAELPADRRRPLEADLSGETIGYRFPGSLQKSLRRLATEREVSMYMLLLSLTEVLLYNYTGESRVVTGTPSLGRDHADLEGQIGFYINTLAVVSEIKSEETFMSLLERTKGQVLRCYEHQGYPFDRLVSELNITREVNRNPLFDLMVAYYHVGKEEQREDQAPGIFSFSGENGTASRFDCRLVLTDTTQGLQLQLNYRTSLFDRSRMERMIGHLERLAEQVVADPQSIVGSLSLLSPQEQERLLTLGQSEAAYPRNKSVVALWREQVGHTPLATALVYGDERLSYQEVDRWSSRVAGWLADQRLLPEERVAVVMDRTIRSIVAILAVLKAGGAFVPLDPAWPQERKLFLWEDAGCRLVLGGEALPESSTEVEDVSGPGNLAYVIYTSGSTGRPKGVLVEQEALIDHIYGGIARMGLDNCRRYGLVSSLVADGNHSMLFSALLTGAELHVLPEELVLDGDRLSGYLQEQQIDCVKMVPSHWLSCGEAGSYPLPGKVLILGGEAFPAGILDRLRAWDYKGKVFNHYGPTEVTIGKSVHEVDLARKYDRVPIGRPFANGRLYILDGAGRLSPTGIPGELHVGGAGLARGYLNRADLTAEKFVADPFVEGGRMYKTGDICRWTAEGEIEYWGRADDQVKVRGYRIEPGEIEGAVLQSGMAEQVAVKVWQERLVGYVVAEEFDQGKLMDYLNVQLPEYLIPKLWMQLESMPLTASGKTDRKQLPEPSISGDSHIAPRTATEIELTAIWQEVLKIDRVGITDNFFELGGHSLLAIRILGRINSRWQIKIGLAELFSSPTVMALANRIGRSVAVVTEAIPLAPAMEHYPVSSGQLRLWVLQQLYPGNYSYNIVHRYTYAGVLDAERLQQALDIVVERHEILRTRFMEFDGEPRQVVLTPEAGRIVAVWSRQSLTDAVRQESRHVFDLTAGPLLRVQVVPTAENVHKLVMNIHHIITDEWSMEVLLREWTDTYEGRMERSPLRIQYKDYAVWQREQLLGSPMEQSQRFWMEQFRDQKPVAELPADHRRSAVADFRGENINYWLPVNLQQQLRRLAAERDVSMYMLLLSLTEVLLYNYTGESRVVTGTPSLGRDHADLEGQIGFYVNTLAISGEVKNEETFVSLLERTKEQVLQCYAHERYPFDRLVSELNITREVNRNPLFDLMVAYHQTEVSVEAIEKDETASKFDCRLVLIDTEQGLQLQLNYRTSLYDRSRMERMIGHLERLAEQVVADPQSIVGSLSLLSPQEQERLLTLGQSEAAYPRNKSVVALWREQVGHTPLATALVYGDERLSYQEVDRWSSRVAGWLADQRLLPEERVAVVMDRTIRSIVAILAVLKAGGAFVPLDPAWPQERKLFLLEDAGCRLVLGGEALPESSTEVEDVSGPGNLAYVIYTSGSTGRPKGVLVEQEALIDHIYGGIARMGLDACHRYGLVSSLVADGNHSMLFSALLTGAELHVLPEELVLDGDRLSGYLQEQQIDCVKMVPSHWLSCGEAGSYPLPGKVLILGGEAFPAGIVDRLRAWDYKGKVFNHYGPTEVTIGKSVYEADLKKNYNRVPIGRPFANGRLYILNGEGRLSPTGIAGELHVGGAGLARGYLNREDLTAEKFVADPFVEGGRMYKTGDICRWTAEGEIEYWGRADDQVKVRGYRIEPGEIEQAVLQSGCVQQVAVVVWQERLLGYVVAEEFDQGKLMDYLNVQLPEYLIPKLWMQLESMPLTASGKTDRKQLPEPSVSGDSYIAPRTATEAELTVIWQEVLKIERVGVADNFFALGGHSLLAIRILGSINQRWGIKVSLYELLSGPTVKALAECVEGAAKEVVELIPVAPVMEHYPLSSGQLRLWVLQQLYPGNYSYNIVHQYTYAGLLEPDRLQQALDTVIDRHEILRTRFVEIEGEPRQVILPPSEGRVLIGWSTQTAAELVRQESRHVFDLTAGPLLRVQVTSTAENVHKLVVNIHHIITDEWSTEVLLREWMEAYEGAVPWSPLRIQYKDYAVWQQEQLAGLPMAESQRFWIEQFAGQEPVAELPADRRRPVNVDFAGETIGYWLPEDLQEGLRRLAAEQGVSLYMTLLSLIGILLYKYTGESRVVTGTPTLGRDHADLEGQIGFYINTLAVVSEIKREEAFISLLQRTKGQVLRCYEHQGYPFDRLVSELNVVREPNRNPLFDVLVTYHQGGERDEKKQTTSKFDCTFTLIDTEEGLQLLLNYRTSLYDRGRMEKMLGHLERLAGQVVSDPSIRVKELTLLGRQEEHQLLAEFQGKEIVCPRDRSWVQLFEEQVSRSPEAIAVVHRNREWSYRELSEQSNRLGHYLLSRDVKKDEVVGICMDRGMDLLVVLLGIQKAVGAYVPVDPQYPEERIGYMLRDTGCRLVLAGGEYVAKVAASVAGEDIEVLEADGEWKWLGSYGPEPVEAQQDGRDLAYVLYTSGSTGKPKGVMVEQGSLLNFLLSMRKLLGVGASSAMVSVTTYVFDISYMELYLVLLAGGRVLVIDREVAQDGRELREMLRRYGPSHMQATPSTWEMLWESGWRNEERLKIISGGEAIGEVLKDRLVEISGEKGVWNMYGPTETTIWSSMGGLHRGEAVTIGRPIGNTRMYVLNEEQQLLPVGVPGELYIGGAGVARGYLNREELTAEKFVADPFVPGGRMYKTGDVCRWTENGEIEYQGRKDEQVKLRGYRIEPGEIEGAVLQSGLVQQVAVAVWQERLVGYVVAAEFDQAKLAAYLGEQLPEYMIPRLWVELETMPLTGNGKLDRKRLPKPSVSDDGYTAPRTATEVELTAIWQEVLKMDRVGITDNFFELGGHSLLAIRILSRINSRWQIKIGLAELFGSPTVAGLASRIGQSGTITTESIPAAPEMEYYPVSSGQFRLWVLQQLYPDNYSYNIVHQYTYGGGLEADRLQRSLDRLVVRHEILRTRFVEVNGEPLQVVLPPSEGRVVIGWHTQPVADVVRQESRHVFDLTTGPLLRVQVVMTAKNVYKLVVNIHHIITDEWSTEVLLREWRELYEGTVEREPLRIQYKDYAVWQQAQLADPSMETSRRFWMEQFAGQEPVAELPADYRRPVAADFTGETIGYWFPSDLQEGLRRLAADRGASMYMLLLSLIEVLMYNYTGESRVVTGTPTLGRDHADLEGQMGFYVNTLAVTGEVTGEEIFLSLLARTKGQVLRCYEHQGYPFDRLVSELNITREVNRNPLFDVLIAYRHRQGETSLPATTRGVFVFTGEDGTTSKFDCMFTFVDTTQGLQLQLNYKPGLYDRSRMERMIGHLERLAEQVVADPGIAVQSLMLLGEAEEQQLLKEFQGADMTYPRDKGLAELFEEQAMRSPEGIALIHQGKEWTYRELDERSNQLGRHLRRLGVAEGKLVGISIGRSVELVLGILGTLKAGGAYVPVDPDYPADRIDYILKDSDAQVLLRAEELLGSEQESKEKLQRQTSLDTPVCMVYTSGSSGMPKGVSLSTGSILNRLYWMWTEYPFAAGERSALKTSTGFLDHMWELFGPMLKGIPSVIFHKAEVLDLEGFIGALTEQGITRLVLVPSLLRAMIKQLETTGQRLPALRYWTCSGEELPESLVQEFRGMFGGEPVLLNLYGSTEVMADVTCKEVGMGGVTIGKPVWNTRVYVLDRSGRLCPVGVPGDIYVSGIQVARGYWNRPELTAEKFIDDPFTAGDLMYKTGDVGRWTAAGEIEYWGRADDQVKVRGYRIEPGEIEGVVLQSGMAEQVAVKVWQERLVGYIVAEGFDQAKLLEYLGSRLPEYMVPPVWMQLKEMPLTASGKTDRKRLPEPSLAGDSYTAPQTATEAELAAIWQDVLNIDRIGITNNFFELGGHSLLAIRILGRINRQWQIKIGLAELFGSPTVAALANRIGRSVAAATESIPVAPVQDTYPLSSGQERLWILQQLYPDNYSYNIGYSYTYDGILEPERLQRSLDWLTERHEILRTRFVEIEGEPRQVILTPEAGRIVPVWSTHPVQEILQQESRRVFDLSVGPLLRVYVVPLTDSRYKLIISLHHIITDEWSMNILLQEWKEAYEGTAQGSPLRIQYKDYAVWQQAQLADPSMETSRRFWMEQFAGQEPVAELPADHRRPLEADFTGETIGYWLPEDLQEGLRRLAAEQGVSLYMTLLSLIEVLLYNYTGESRVVTGTPTLGREHADLEGQVGFYVNTLAMVGEIKGEEAFISLLERTKGQVLRCYEHQGYPFDRLVSELNITREVNRNPLFDVLIAYRQGEEEQHLSIGTSGAFSFSGEDGTASKFDCTFNIIDTEQRLQLQLNYKSCLYERSRMERMIGHLERLAEQVVADPGVAVQALELLSEGEERQLMTEFQGPVVDYGADRTLPGMFTRQARWHGSRVALVYRGREWTYKEVDELSNQLGNYLQKEYGIGREELVGVLLGRGEWQVISLLAVLKTGAAYVPVDPAYPAERVNYLRQDGGWRVCVDESEIAKFLLVQEQYSPEGSGVTVSGDQLAYVLYTSGSTGRPKGCMLEHRGVVNRLEWMWREYGMTEEEVFLQKTTFTFDVSVWELFLPLCWGGKLVLCEQEDLHSPQRLAELVGRYGVTCIHFVPSMLGVFMSEVFGSDQLVQQLSSLKRVIASGEALGTSLVDRWHEQMAVPLYNLYGPTEASIDVSHYETVAGMSIVPIGRPVANTRLYVVDGQGRLSPVGVPGELWIGGVQVARGYWNREALTAEKFVADPFQPGSRVYKTGDRARWMADGNIEYLGRIDEQVKVRGYRIEPGEIEGVVLQSGMVQQAVVMAREDSTGNRRLVGYIVAEGFDQAKLVEYLGSRLPEYMVPQLWVELDALPLTASGKTDRKQLPEPSVSGDSYTAPQTATEAELAAIWQDVLKMDRIGITDNFFELGGHSLQAIRILGRINRQWQIKIGLAELFGRPTVKALAERLDGVAVGTTGVIPLAPVMDHYPVSSGQLRMWILQQLYPDNYSYNIVHQYTYIGVLEPERLQQALDSVVARHEILRTRFVEIEEEPRQVVLSPEAGRVTAVWSTQPAQEILRQESRHVFDLSVGPLLRVYAVQQTGNRYKLIISLHHIITDEWSTEILLREWTEAYEGTVRWLPLRIQYKDYAMWQQEQLGSEGMDRLRGFWMEQFTGQEPVAELPADHRRPAVTEFAGETIGYGFPANIKEGLRRLAAEREVSMYMLLLSLIEVLLYNYTGESRVVTGTPTLGREHADLEGQIGFYVNTLAMVGEVRGEEAFLSLLARTKGQVLRCYEHQGYPFDRLVSELNITREVNRNPLFDILVAYHHRKGDKDLPAGIPGALSFSGEDGTTSKFDCSFTFFDTDQGLQLQLTYKSSLYERSRMERMLGHLERLAEQVVAGPDITVEELRLLSEGEERQLMTEFQGPVVDYGADRTLPGMFSRQARWHGSRVALVYQGREWTYKEVDELSNQLGNYLQKEYGIGREELVGVLLGRGEWQVISLLAVLKTGAAYVPVDPAYPAERVNYLRQDGGWRVCVDESEIAKFLLVQEQYSPEGSGVTVSGDQLAYVLYTSGSTGRPKGCMVEHRGVVNRLEWMWQEHRITENDIFLQKTTFTFDVSVWEFFQPLCRGGKLVLCEQEDLHSPQRLAELVAQYRVTCIHFVPSMLGDPGRGVRVGPAGAAAVIAEAGDRQRRGAGDLAGRPVVSGDASHSLI